MENNKELPEMDDLFGALKGMMGKSEETASSKERGELIDSITHKVLTSLEDLPVSDLASHYVLVKVLAQLNKGVR
jgi:hypothetical protein